MNNKIESNIPYVLYARKSNESSDKQIESIDNQIKVMKSEAERNGLKIVRIFSEKGSAKKPGTREEFQKMLQMIHDGKAKGIITWHLNRLFRSPAEGGLVQQMLQDNDILVIRTHDRVYLPGDNALLMSIESGMASQFVRDLREAVNRGMMNKVEKGWLPGRPPIGYVNNRYTRKIDIDTERFHIVRKIWDYMLTGRYSVSEVTRLIDKNHGLQSRLTKNKGGCALSVSSVYSLLQNRFYAGDLPFRDHTYKGKHTPMVTHSEFDEVQALIKKRNPARPSLKKKTHLFTED